MPKTLGENPQVSAVRKTSRFSPDSHCVSHANLPTDNALARRFSAFSAILTDVLTPILTPVRPLEDGVNERTTGRRASDHDLANRLGLLRPQLRPGHRLASCQVPGQ